LLGVSRLCARPGAQTKTLRSRPTSEFTAYLLETGTVCAIHLPFSVSDL
jgi:hypothetical protein